MIPWRAIGLFAAITLLGMGLVLFSSAAPPTPYQQATTTAVQNITANPNNPATNPTGSPTSGGGTGGGTGAGTGGGSTGGGGTGTTHTISVLGGTPTAFDLAMVFGGILILMALTFSLFRGRWTAVKVIALVVVLVVGSIAVLYANEYVDSLLVPYSSSMTFKNGTANTTIPILGMVYFSGSVGLANGGTAPLAATQPISQVTYNQAQVSALAVRVDVVLQCQGCAFNITNGYAVLHFGQVGGSARADARNVTYHPLAFNPGASVNLYNQAFNVSQLGNVMGSALACGLAQDWNVTLQGGFTLKITAGATTVVRQISFGWVGLRIGRSGPACPGAPPTQGVSGPYTTTNQNFLYYKFIGFGPAYYRG